MGCIAECRCDEAVEASGSDESHLVGGEDRMELCAGWAMSRDSCERLSRRDEESSLN